MVQQSQADKRERLQALYLLKSGQCQQIQDVAEIVSRHRSTVHRWLHHYREGGLARLVGPGAPPPGRKPAIPPWAQAKRKRRLEQPRGFGSYVEIQQWLASESGLQVNDDVVHEVCTRSPRRKTQSPSSPD